MDSLDLRFRLARGKTHRHYFVGGFCCQPLIEIVRNDNSVFDVLCSVLQNSK